MQYAGNMYVPYYDDDSGIGGAPHMDPRTREQIQDDMIDSDKQRMRVCFEKVKALANMFERENIRDYVFASTFIYFYVNECTNLHQRQNVASFRGVKVELLTSDQRYYMRGTLESQLQKLIGYDIKESVVLAPKYRDVFRLETGDSEILQKFKAHVINFVERVRTSLLSERDLKAKQGDRTLSNKDLTFYEYFGKQMNIGNTIHDFFENLITDMGAARAACEFCGKQKNPLH